MMKHSLCLLVLFLTGIHAFSHTVDSLIAHADENYKEGDYNQVIHLLKNSDEEFSLSENHQIQRLKLLGLANLGLNQVNTSIERFKEAEQLCLLSGDLQDEQLIICYERLGWIYRYKRKNPYEAVTYFLKEKELLQIDSSAHEQNQLYNYYNLSGTYRLLGDLENAFVYGFQTMELMQKSGDSYGYFWEWCYNLFGNLYNETNNYEKAIEFYNKTLEVTKNETNEFNALCNLGASYIALENFPQSIVTLKQAEELLQKHPGLNSSKLYRLFGRANTQHLSTASSYYQKSLDFSDDKSSSRDVRRTLTCLGDLHSSNGSLDSALYYYNYAISSSAGGLIRTDFLSFPEDQLINNPLLFDVIHERSNVLYQKFKEEHQIEFLYASFEGYKKCSMLIDQFISVYEMEGSLLALLSKDYPFYQNVLKCVYALYEHTSDNKYVEYALEFMESSKAVILKKAISESITANISNDQGKLFFELGKLKCDLDYFRKEIKNAKNEEEIIHTNSLLSDVLSKKSRIENEIERTYPNYSNLETSNGLQLKEAIYYNKKNNCNIIEYFVGKEYVYAVVLDKADVFFLRTEVDTTLESSLHRYLELVTTSKFDQESFINYCKTAYYLYDRLLKEPLSLVAQEDQLIIIPDMYLASIPFEALLVTLPDPATSAVDYKNLNYVVKSKSVHYCPSIELLLLLSEQRQILRDPVIHSFAFSGDNQELGQVATENNYIKTLFGDNASIYVECTEETFKTNTWNADIIHCATHGTTSLENEFEMALEFAPDPNNDGRLFGYETYMIPFNCQLATLSSCETFKGKLNEGEGIYSLSRAFLSSGCLSSVGSLWKSDDYSSAAVMLNFYESILAGEGISSSLQKSKLNYIANSDELSAHPSKWAMFISSGASLPITNPKDLPFLWIIGLLGLSAFIVIRMTLKIIRSRD